MKKFFWFVIANYREHIWDGDPNSDSHKAYGSHSFYGSEENTEKTYEFFCKNIHEHFHKTQSYGCGKYIESIEVICVENSEQNKELAEKMQEYLNSKLKVA